MNGITLLQNRNISSSIIFCGMLKKTASPHSEVVHCPRNMNPPVDNSVIGVVTNYFIIFL